MWPFGKKKSHTEPQPDSAQRNNGGESADSVVDRGGEPDAHVPTQPDTAPTQAAGETGPFDGDTVDIDTFDFSDFAVGILNLGSLKLPIPKEAQVQVEMGPSGPQMLHLVTSHGRITPVAFAAPRSGGWWQNTVAKLMDKMREDGIKPRTEPGFWGEEIVSEQPNGELRIIGIDGPRWMLRFTLAAPSGHAEQLATQARELAARTFVYRGDDPILAGNSLPVAIPRQLAEQLQQAIVQRRNAQQQQERSDTEAKDE